MPRLQPQLESLLEDPNIWRADFDDEDGASVVPVSPPARKSLETKRPLDGDASPSSSPPRSRPPLELSPRQTVSSTDDENGQGQRARIGLAPSSMAAEVAPPPQGNFNILSSDGPQEEKPHGLVIARAESQDSQAFGFGGPLGFRQQNSLLSHQSKASLSDFGVGSGSKPRTSFTSAMRFLGFGNAADATSIQDIAVELYELCFSICLATAPEVANFVEAFAAEDKKALRRLSATGKRTGLLGQTTKTSGMPAPVAELARAFVAQGFEDRAPGRMPKGKVFMQSGSLSSVNISAKSSLTNSSNEPGGAAADSRLNSRVMPRRGVSFDAGEDEDTDGRPKTLGLQRAPLDRSRSDLGKVLAFNRSMSDLSCTSFTDFNRRQNRPVNGAVGGAAKQPESVVRPTFLDFLTSLNQDGTAPLQPSSQLQLATGPPQQLQLPGARAGVLDTVSEAGMSYHSSMDMAFGSEGEGHEVSQAKVINMGSAMGGSQSTVKIAFKTPCLRTENEMQRQLIQQHRFLLDMVHTKLKAKEMEVQAGDELREEQKELLKGFRKIISREVAEDEGTKPFSIFIVERDEQVKSDVEELCRILEYNSQSFRGLSTAMVALKEDLNPPLLGKIESDKSKASWTAPGGAGGAGGGGGLSSTESSGDDLGRLKDQFKLLEGRPELIKDWRSQALLPRKKKEPKTAKYHQQDDTIRIVLLGYAWLDKELPKEWLKNEGIFVVLTSEAEDFENVGKFLFASGEAEIREKLHNRGIHEYLLHPLSLEGLRGVVTKAFRRRYGDEFLLLQAVGRGTTGVVHRAKRLRDGGAFALKEINTRRMSRTARQEVERESQLLSELKWPSVIFLVDTWENATDRLRYILMPLLDGGSLHQRIEMAAKQEEKKASPERITEWYVQSLHGLTYLHWRGVLHRDIKPGNLLLSGNDDRSLQIGDLGSAMLLPGYGPHPMKRNTTPGSVCTPLYSPPEVLVEETYSVGSDMWSLGASFYEVLTLKTFFPSGQGMQQLQDEAKRYDWRTGHWHSELSRLRASSSSAVADMAELMRRDPFQRPLASELLGHTTSSRRLKEILGSTGALASLDRKIHFEELSRIRAESSQAANLDPQQFIARVPRPQPATTHLSFGPSSLRPTSPSDKSMTRSPSSTTGAVRGLARAGSGVGNMLIRAGSGAVGWSKGGRNSFGEQHRL